ncbi:ankyrin repeat domain-containing protein [Cystobacter fuscus]|uniref:ankyrin repeat domain-containing protein n=1 Tax=Cystobacter fuscus TaxID=43 RepID=UPI002B2BED5E|nr:ankyrin repeat domain-containing protein [Cystobacter fuscus]
MRLPGLFLTLLAALMLLPPVPVRAEDVSGRTQRGRADTLHAAVVRGDRALVRQLLQAGADPNAQDARANTPLMLATDAPMVELLVAGGANARAEDTQGRTLVGRIAATASREEPRVQLLRAVVRAGADVDRANRAGETPLEVAARRGDIELVREMLWLGARVPRALEGTSIRVALPMPSGAGVRLAEEWGWHERELVLRRMHVRLITSAAEAVSMPLELGSPLDEALNHGALELAVDGPDDQSAPAEVAQQTESVMSVSEDGPWIVLTDWKTGRSAWTVAPALAPGRWQLIGLDALPAPFPAFTPGELEAAIELGASLSTEDRSRWLAVLRRFPESAKPSIHRMRIRLHLASGAVKTLELRLPTGC